KPAEIDPLIKNWSQFYSLKDKSIFKNDLKNFMSAWSGASSLVGPWYVEVVQREIASQEAEEARQARLKAEREAENNKYRDMFRRRIFNDW
ncbi:MAG: hypothetical protein KDD38_07005, partial [Bdellovibrionales bacterium]|nr:hypothetical protein [Bdellovibrionales bacterium]